MAKAVAASSAETPLFRAFREAISGSHLVLIVPGGPISPNAASLLRLATALVMENSEDGEAGRTYIDKEDV